MFDMYSPLYHAAQLRQQEIDDLLHNLITTAVLVKGEGGGCVDIRTHEMSFQNEIHLLCLSNFFE